MAEEFEGPVVGKRPTGQPSEFEVANFDGGVFVASHALVRGTVAARGNLDSEGGVNTGFVKLFGNVQAPGSGGNGPGGGVGAHDVTCVLDCQAEDALNVKKHLIAEGDVNAQNVHVTGDVIVYNTDISIRQMAQTLATIDARTAEMNQKLDERLDRLKTLSSNTARMPDGRSLVNVVGTIWDKVNTP
jgi:hypothetical protein